MINVGDDYGGQGRGPAQADFAAISLTITNGTTEVMFCPGCVDMIVAITGTGLQSVNSISVQVEGSLDNSGWDNLDSAVTVISVNGTTLFLYTGSAPPYVRVTGLENDPAVITAKAWFGRMA